jgi:hypothetical protein
MLRLIPMIAALSLGAAAFAQTPPSSTVLQVQLLAPQLLAFSGSSANFESLVNGLTLGTPVTLTTVGADAGVQIVTFLPGTTLPAADAARRLEAARQSLISRGIALPNAQQLAIALMGGTLPTPAGSTSVTGVVSGNAGAVPIQVRNELAASPVLGTGGSLNLSQANLQALRTGLTQGTPVILAGAGGSVTFAPPGGAMSAFEANQALQLASALLAQQGILDPTPEQLRVALLGGNLGPAAGNVAVQGVLQGQIRNTSDSRLFGTSDSRVIGTSNTPPSVNPVGGALSVPGANRATPIFGASRR